MTRSGGRTAGLMLLAALALGPARLSSQAPAQGPVFRGGVELVDVDVVVFDKTTGEPIRGLKTSDFTIIDRKRPQPVATFSEINFDHDPATPQLPPDLPLDVADNRTARATRLVVLVVDDLHIAQSLTDRTKEIVRTVLKDLGPQATVGLAFTSGKPGVELTEDRALVYKQIDAFRGMQKRRGGGFDPAPLSTSAATGGRPGTGSASEAALADAGGSSGSGGGLGVREPRSELASSEYWLANSLHNTLATDAKILGTEALRRKAFVLISEGIPTDIQGLFDTMEPRPPTQGMSRNPSGLIQGPAGQSEVDDDLLHAMDMMRRANVALYAIDPGAGLGAFGPSGPDPNLMTSGPQRLSVLRGWPNSPQTLSAGYLTQLSDFSGGFAITSGDSLEGGLATLLGDLDHYYMLGFVPPATDKSWHDIQVLVDVPNAIVRSRRGYRLGAETAPPKNTKEPLAGFAAKVLPATELSLKMFATPLPSTGQKLTRMAITMQIQADRDALREADGGLRDTLHMFTMAVDVKTKKLTPTSIKRTREVTLTPVPGAAVPTEITYQIVSEWQLPPGQYQLRTTVQSDKMHKAGAVYLVTDVPNFNKADVALSGLVLGYADPGRHPVDGTAIEHQLMTLEPVLERVFAPSDALRLSYEIWRKNRTDPATTELRILDDRQRLVRMGAEHVPVSATGHVDVTVPLTDLTPGPYVLSIVATARGKTDTRAVGFFVR